MTKKFGEVNTTYLYLPQQSVFTLKPFLNFEGISSQMIYKNFQGVATAVNVRDKKKAIKYANEYTYIAR